MQYKGWKVENKKNIFKNIHNQRDDISIGKILKIIKFRLVSVSEKLSPVLATEKTTHKSSITGIELYLLINKTGERFSATGTG